MAEPKVLPDFLSNIDSMSRCNEAASVKDEKLIVLYATWSVLVVAK